jgi:signal peptidase II
MNTSHPPLATSSSFATLAALVTLATAALDQVTKYLILFTLSPGDSVPVIPGLFNLTLTFNLGAAFGLWSGLPSGVRELVLALTNLLALGVVVYFMRQPHYRSSLAQTALAGILGGAIGNIIDRFVHGSVVDFLDFYVGRAHWPAFNVADSAICVGVTILLVLSFFAPTEPANTSS